MQRDCFVSERAARFTGAVFEQRRATHAEASTDVTGGAGKARLTKKLRTREKLGESAARYASRRCPASGVLPARLALAHREIGMFLEAPASRTAATIAASAG